MFDFMIANRPMAYFHKKSIHTICLNLNTHTLVLRWFQNVINSSIVMGIYDNETSLQCMYDNSNINF